MVLKCICLVTILAVSRAGNIGQAAVVPAPVPVVAARFSDATYDLSPQYSFGYDVQDALTGDSKAQVESRSGDFVQGQYSLNDPDGTRRIVDYTADPVNGFNAVVRRASLTVVAPVAAKAVAAPVAVPAAQLIANVAPGAGAYVSPARLNYPFV